MNTRTLRRLPSPILSKRLMLTSYLGWRPISGGVVLGKRGAKLSAFLPQQLACALLRRVHLPFRHAPSLHLPLSLLPRRACLTVPATRLGACYSTCSARLLQPHQFL